MMNNRLGFALQRAIEGLEIPRVCNGGPWERKVWDIRDYLGHFDGLEGAENFLTLLSFNEEGCFVTLLRTATGGRQGDYISGWIYIPRGLDIPTSDVSRVYDDVKDFLRSGTYPDDIDKHFETEYSSKKFFAKSSWGEEALAVRYTGNDAINLFDILEAGYQPCYAKYRVIFLLDKEGNVKTKVGSSIEDLTSEPLQKWKLLIPPDDPEKEYGKGTKIYHERGEFLEPFEEYIDEKTEEIVIPIKLKREPFWEAEFNWTIEREGGNVQKFNPTKEDIQWKRKITPSMFLVKDRKRRYEIGKEMLTIRINGDLLLEPIFLFEKECGEVKVEISAQGYATHNQYFNLLEKPCPEILLEKKCESYSLSGSVNGGNGNNRDREANSRDCKGTTSAPGEGYKGRVVTGWSSKKGIFALVASFVIGIVIGFIGVYVVCPINNANVKAKTSDKAAIEYMDGAEVWELEKLESYECTKGLWEEMNQYEFSKIAQRNIEGCDRFKKVKDLSSEVDQKGITLTGSYCNKNDSRITVQSWLNKVAKDLKKAYSSTPGTSSTGEPSSVGVEGSQGDKKNGGL